MKNYTIVYIPIEKIEADNSVFPSLSEHIFNGLIESIKQAGILQPLLVKKYSSNGKYKLISGFNRLKAAKSLNINEIPCVIVDNDIEAEATFDTDLFRRHLTTELYNKFYEDKKSFKKTDNLIDEFKSLENILSEDVKKTLQKIEPHIQKQIYRSIPEKVIKDEKEIQKLQKQLDIVNENNTKLNSLIKDYQKEISELKNSIETYKTLADANERKIKELIAKKEEEIRKKYEEETPLVVEQKIEEATAELQMEYEKLLEEKEKKINELSKKRFEFEEKLKNIESQEKKDNKEIEKLKTDYQNALDNALRMQTILTQLLKTERFIKETKAVENLLDSSLENIKTLRDRMIEAKYESLANDNIDGIKSAVGNIRPLLERINNVLTEIEKFLKIKNQ